MLAIRCSEANLHAKRAKTSILFIVLLMSVMMFVWSVPPTAGQRFWTEAVAHAERTAERKLPLQEKRNSPSDQNCLKPTVIFPRLYFLFLLFLRFLGARSSLTRARAAKYLTSQCSERGDRLTEKQRAAACSSSKETRVAHVCDCDAPDVIDCSERCGQLFTPR
jgi:hypothetical protein